MSGYKMPAGEGKTSAFIVLVLSIISVAECIFFAFLWNLTIGF